MSMRALATRLIGFSVGIGACRCTSQAGGRPSASDIGARAEPTATRVSSPSPVASSESAVSEERANAIRNQADCPEGMLFVPAADPAFAMPAIGSEDRTPRPQRFHVDAFCIDRTEVPMDKWSDALCGQRVPGCVSQASRSGPAVCIDPSQAECHCEKAAPGVRKRLPTDPEFLLAALGTDGRIHPWGNDPVPNGAQIGRNFCPQQDGPAKDWTCNVSSNTLDVSPYGVIGLASNGNEMTGTCVEAAQRSACVVRSDGGIGLLLAYGLSARVGAVGTSATLGFRCATSDRIRSEGAR